MLLLVSPHAAACLTPCSSFSSSACGAQGASKHYGFVEFALPCQAQAAHGAINRSKQWQQQQQQKRRQQQQQQPALDGLKR
jgi:hypothetical protein